MRVKNKTRHKWDNTDKSYATCVKCNLMRFVARKGWTYTPDNKRHLDLVYAPECINPLPLQPTTEALFEFINLPIEALLPLIEMCKDYFDHKYPSDTDISCGDSMPPEDVWKYKIYNALLMQYNLNKDGHDLTHSKYIKSLEQFIIAVKS